MPTLSELASTKPVEKQAEKKPAPVKKSTAKKSVAKPSVQKETVKHPFGTCVPLGECVCNKKGNS